MGTQLAGKTLGIVGLGRIGQAVATRAAALEMQILGYDPFLSAAAGQGAGHRDLSPRPGTMLPHVDYLTVHTPLNDETRNLVGPRKSRRMKKGVRLINCARGGIYNEAGAGRRAKSGHIGRRGAGRLSAKSPARTARCSACPTCSARRTWGPAPKRPRPTWPWKRPNC